MLGKAATKYFSLLNKQAAATVLRGTRGSFRSALKTSSAWASAGMAGKIPMSPFTAGARSLGAGDKHYFWSGATTAERAARIGTAAGAGLLAGNFVNPRNNFGPF